jgi:integrase/recombinase XerD
MGRRLEFKPCKNKDGTFSVNVPDWLSATGRRARKTCQSRAEALRFIEELKARKDNLTLTKELSPTQVLDAAEALEILATHPSVTLRDCARAYCERVSAQVRSITLEDLFTQVLQAHADSSDSYRRDIRWVKGRLAGLMDRLVSDITRADILDALVGYPESSRNNHLRTLTTVFRYAEDREYLTEIPLRSSDRTPNKRQEVDVLPVSEIRKLLETALVHDLQILPLLLVETFCGIRPEEAKRLLWTDIDLLRKRVTVRAAISKTGSARPIILEPCALAWFECYVQRGGVFSEGLLAPFATHTITNRLVKIRARAGYHGHDWTPGALRDSFCSNHLNHFGSVDRLMIEAGHTDFRTTKDHYLGVVTSEAAAEFWALFPPSVNKVVSFAAGR